MALSLSSVSQQSLVTFLVKFTQDPLAVSSKGVHDALNPKNYKLAGPGSALITGVSIVPGQTSSCNLYVAAPLATGTWTLTVSAVQDLSGNPIVAPTSFQFTVSSSSLPTPVSAGATNDDPEEVIRAFFNPALKGRAWDSLISSIAKEEKANWDLAQLAYKQLYKATASGIYLTRKAGDDGVERPLNVGMSDDTFRKFAIAVVNNQLTEEAFLEVLEVFYGSDSVRAFGVTSLAQPFALNDQDDLRILVDEETVVNTVFSASAFAQIGQAQAIEVAAALTRSFEFNGTLAWALPIVDNTTGLTKVKIYSPSKGLASSMRVTGGKAQNALQFSTPLALLNGSLPTWNITTFPATGVMRFTTTGANGLSLLGLRIGDYVNVFGGEFLSQNRGSFPVTNVSVSYPSGLLTQYFEVSNPAATAQTGLAQVQASSVMYFRPTRSTVHTALNRAVTVSIPADRADIKLPATSIAVNRQARSAAYGQLNPGVAVSTLTRQAGVVTVVAPNHGLSVGSSFFLDGTLVSRTAPTRTNGDATHTAYSQATIWSSFAWPVAAHLWAPVVTLTDGRVLIIGGIDPAGNYLAYDDILTVGAAIPHPGGTQYPITLIQDAGIDAFRAWSSAVLLTDPAAAGQVLLFGGTGLASYATNSKLYTPGVTTGSWGSSATVVTQCVGRAAVNRTTDNKVMAIGGGTYTGGAQSVCEVYTYRTNSWASIAALNIARCQCQAVQLNDGTVLAVGGRTGTSFTSFDYVNPSDFGALTNSCEVYNVGGNTWTQVGSMSFARIGHQLFKLSDGRVIAIGGIGYNPGQNTTNAYLASTEIYNPTLKTWGPGPTMRVARAFFAAGIIGTRLYVSGGNTTDTSSEYLDLNTMTWSLSSATIGTAAIKTLGTVTGSLLCMSYGQNGASGTSLSLLTPASDTFSSGDLTGLRQVASVIDANTFTYSTPRTQGYTAATGGTITAFQSQKAAAGLPGPYVFDPVGGVAVSNISTTTTQAISANHQYGVLSVGNTSQFPNSPGFICIALGYKYQTAPIPYLGVQSNGALILDYSFVFPHDIPSGASVIFLRNKGAFIPKTPESDGAFYLTDSQSGRLAATSTIEDIAGGGLDVNIDIIYPGDRGLANQGYPTHGNYKISDVVGVFGSSTPAVDEQNARVS